MVVTVALPHAEQARLMFPSVSVIVTVGAIIPVAVTDIVELVVGGEVNVDVCAVAGREERIAGGKYCLKDDAAAGV